MADAIPVFNIVHISVDMSEEMRGQFKRRIQLLQNFVLCVGL